MQTEKFLEVTQVLKKDVVLDDKGEETSYVLDRGPILVALSTVFSIRPHADPQADAPLGLLEVGATTQPFVAVWEDYDTLRTMVRALNMQGAPSVVGVKEVEGFRK